MHKLIGRYLKEKETDSENCSSNCNENKGLSIYPISLGSCAFTEY